MTVSVACIAGMFRWSINYVLEGRSKEKVVGRHFWSYQGKPREIVIHYRSPDMEQ